MTPDELRKLADSGEDLLSDGFWGDLHAAADAWEMDRQTIRDAGKAITDYLVLTADNVSLRKRLEEAEKLLALTLEYLSSEMELYKSIRAALAREEKP